METRKQLISRKLEEAREKYSKLEKQYKRLTVEAEPLARKMKRLEIRIARLSESLKDI